MNVSLCDDLNIGQAALTHDQKIVKRNPLDKMDEAVTIIVSDFKGEMTALTQVTWLAIGYNVPANPSKNRVYVWRKLKDYGACYFRPGVAILPKTSQSMTQFSLLGKKIREMGGEASLADLRFVDPSDEQRTIKIFHERIKSEYAELMMDCKAVIETLKDSLIPERNADLIRKITRKYKKARGRDYFKFGPGGEMNEFLDELTEHIAHSVSEFAHQIKLIINS